IDDGAPVTHRDKSVADSRLDYRIEFQESQVIGDSRTFFTYALAHLFLRKLDFLHQTLIRQCNFNRIQVMTLYVLHERHGKRFMIVRNPDESGNGFEPGHLRSAQTPFSGDELIFIEIRFSDGDRLDDTQLADRSSEFLKRFLVEIASRLEWIDLDRLDVDFHDATYNLIGILVGYRFDVVFRIFQQRR